MAAPDPVSTLDSGDGFLFVIRQRDFQRVWLAQIAAQVGDKFLMFSLLILAYRLSGGSTPVAVTLLAYTLPAMVVGPAAGVFADRHDRKRIMVWTSLARAAFVVLIPAASWVPWLRGDYLHLLVITVAFSVAGQLFSPAESAAIPSILPRRALLTANSLVTMTVVATLVIGGTLAPIVSRVDIYLPYWIAAGLFAVAGLLIVAVRIPPPPPAAAGGDRHPFHQFVIEFKEGIDILRGSAGMMVSFLQLSLAMLVMFMMFTLAPAYASRIVGIPTQDTYVVLVPATVGAFVSGIGLGQFGRGIRRSRLLLLGLGATGLTLLVLAAGPALLHGSLTLRQHTRLFAAAFSLALGLEVGGMLIPAVTYLMENSSDANRGRIFSLVYVVINGATALPVLVAAALADLVGTDRVIGGLGVVLLVATAALVRFAGAALEQRSG